MNLAMIGKTIWVPALVVIALGTAGHPQTVLSLLLDDLARYFSAAARLTASAVTGVDKVEAAQIPSAERQQARDELRRISQAFSMLRARQTPLVEDLTQYSRTVRERGIDPEATGRSWRLILSEVQAVSGVVAATVDIAESSKWLKATFDEKDRLALREVLLGRASLLDRLRALPAPGAPEELDQLDRMNQHYRQLMASLNALNIALTRATDRLQ